jgi:hypothetical protein
MTTIKLKNGSGAPTAGDLVQGEPALDLTNKRLYTEDSGGTVIEVGTNPGTDVTFADNRKAIFGAGSDLQIYSDGTNSYIQEGSGTSGIRITSDNQVAIRKHDDEDIAVFNVDGAVRFYHDNAQKFSTTSTGIDVTGTITFDGGTTSADINFGDNDKAIFGAGSDLQIYHDASHSYIVDAGTGNMYLSTNGNGIVMQASLSETMFSALPNGSVRLYHDNSQKLETTSTGIDVTGSVTADDIVISNGSPTLTFYETDTTNLNARFDNGGGDLYIQTVHDDGTNAKTRILVDHSDGDISFFNNAGSSQDFYWDASTSRLGLGTTSPSFKLTLEDSAPYFRTKNTSAPTDEKTWDYNAGTDGIFRFRATNDAGNTSNNWLTVNRTGATIDYIAMHTASGTERMRINSSGNVGIGVVPETDWHSNYTALQVNTGGALASYASGTTFGTAISTNQRTTGDTFVNGNKYIANAAAQLYLQDNGGNHIWYNAASGTADATISWNERMRIDSSGRMQVAKSSHLYTTVGVQLGTYSSNSIDNTTQFTHNNSGGASVVCVAPTSESLITFYRQDTGGFMGHIRNDSSNSVSYFTSSDERLKDNIVDAPSASDDIDAIQVRSFDWKADGSHQKYGVIAQELNNVIPSAVDMTQDENKHASVDYSKLVPMLVKEIQSLRARVAQLEGAN